MNSHWNTDSRSRLPVKVFDLFSGCGGANQGFQDARMEIIFALDWAQPASTLTTRCISYSNGRLSHPEQDCAISVREAAYLQTSPMDFSFSDKMYSRAPQIENAIPVRFAKTAGLHIERHLTEMGVH